MGKEFRYIFPAGSVALLVVEIQCVNSAGGSEARLSTSGSAYSRKFCSVTGG